LTSTFYDRDFSLIGYRRCYLRSDISSSEEENPAMARIVTLAVSLLVISLFGVGKESFAESAKLDKENDVQVIPAEVLDSYVENLGGQGIPIPNIFGDQEETATKTLELRIKNRTCPGVAQLAELVSDCQFVISAPLKVQ
jgi:hypothetical protein